MMPCGSTRVQRRLKWALWETHTHKGSCTDLKITHKHTPDTHLQFWRVPADLVDVGQRSTVIRALTSGQSDLLCLNLKDAQIILFMFIRNTQKNTNTLTSTHLSSSDHVEHKTLNLYIPELCPLQMTWHFSTCAETIQLTWSYMCFKSKTSFDWSLCVCVDTESSEWE